MEVMFRRRDQKANKGIGWVKILELRKNRACLIGGGHDGQGNIIKKIFKPINVSYLRERLGSGGRSL